MDAYGWVDSALSKERGARVIIPGGYVNNFKLLGGAYSEVFISSRAYVPNGYRFPTAAAEKSMPTISGLKQQWFYYGKRGTEVALDMISSASPGLAMVL